MFKSKSSSARKLARLEEENRAAAAIPKQDYLDDCHRTYSCIHCRTHLANHDELISKLFQGNHGRAYLFNKVVNIACKQAITRELLTGLHAVCDIYCKTCETTLGWKYEQAFVASQKYKEGKYIIELVHMLKENNSDLTSYNYSQAISKQTSELGVSSSSSSSSSPPMTSQRARLSLHHERAPLPPGDLWPSAGAAKTVTPSTAERPFNLNLSVGELSQHARRHAHLRNGSSVLATNRNGLGGASSTARVAPLVATSVTIEVPLAATAGGQQSSTTTLGNRSPPGSSDGQPQVVVAAVTGDRTPLAGLDTNSTKICIRNEDEQEGQASEPRPLFGSGHAPQPVPFAQKLGTAGGRSISASSGSSSSSSSSSALSQLVADGAPPVGERIGFALASSSGGDSASSSSSGSSPPGNSPAGTTPAGQVGQLAGE